MKRFIILIIVTIVTLRICGQTDSTRYPVPGQMQCRVIAITNQKRNHADLTCINQKGDSVFLRYGWKGLGTRYTAIRVGVWLTVQYRECRKGEWLEAKITVNH